MYQVSHQIQCWKHHNSSYGGKDRSTAVPLVIGEDFIDWWQRPTRFTPAAMRNGTSSPCSQLGELEASQCRVSPVRSAQSNLRRSCGQGQGRWVLPRLSRDCYYLAVLPCTLELLVNSFSIYQWIETQAFAFSQEEKARQQRNRGC